MFTITSPVQSCLKFLKDTTSCLSTEFSSVCFGDDPESSQTPPWSPESSPVPNPRGEFGQRSLPSPEPHLACSRYDLGPCQTPPRSPEPPLALKPLEELGQKPLPTIGPHLPYGLHEEPCQAPSRSPELPPPSGTLGEESQAPLPSPEPSPDYAPLEKACRDSPPSPESHLVDESNLDLTDDYDLDPDDVSDFESHQTPPSSPEPDPIDKSDLELSREPIPEIDLPPPYDPNVELHHLFPPNLELDLARTSDLKISQKDQKLDLSQGLPQEPAVKRSTTSQEGDGSFGAFASLPEELRSCIWESSVRPREPGVHFFDIPFLNTKTRVPRSQPGLMEMTAQSLTRLRSPRVTKSSQLRPARNPSTYLMDTGMKTACKEAYLARKRTIKRLNKDDSRKDVSMIRYLAEDGITSRQTEVMPDKDLFVLNLPESFFAYVDCLKECPRRESQKRSLSATLFRRLQPVVCRDMVCLVPLFERAVSHVAVEYSEEWADQKGPWQRRWAIFDVFLESAFENNGFRNLWFVDYSLEKKHHVATKEEVKSGERRRVFHAVDRTFTEVECTPRSLSSWKYDQTLGNGARANSIWFIMALRYLIGYQSSVAKGLRTPYKVGLLACEFKSDNNNKEKEKRKRKKKERREENARKRRRRKESQKSGMMLIK